jgi:hypothetical protein
LKAAAFKTDWTTSDTRAYTYTMNFGTLAAPTVTPATGTYESSASIEMSSSQSGATIRYTTNGSTPTGSSTIYTSPVYLESTTTIKAKAFHPDYTTSAETSRVYTIAVAAPTFSPTAGTYTAGQTVTVASASSGATIRYTINGADPVETDPTIASGATLVLGNYTLKAKAWRTGATASAVSAAAYLITGDVTTPLLAGGETHSLALREDGVAWGWGSNGYGQVGDGTTTTPRLFPRIVGGLTGATAVDAATNYSLVLKNDGTVVAFGRNESGRFGNGGTTNSSWPTPVSNLSTAIGIAAGNTHAAALKADGTIVAWGSNGWGEVGDGTNVTPARVAAEELWFLAGNRRIFRKVAGWVTAGFCVGTSPYGVGAVRRRLPRWRKNQSRAGAGAVSRSAGSGAARAGRRRANRGRGARWPARCGARRCRGSCRSRRSPAGRAPTRPNHCADRG